ncbi:MAG: hypothetical protein AAF985_02660 [Bacteroidota bacterium]
MKNHHNLLRLFFLLVLLSTSLRGYGQTVLTIDGGHLVQSSNSIIRLHDTQFINNGTFHGEEDSKVYITGNGSDEQSAIGGDSVTTFYQLEVFKSSNGVQLQQNIVVEAELIVEEGNLDLNGDTVTFGPNGFIEIETEDGRIVGPNGGVVQITLDLNAPNNSIPGGMGFQISSSQNLGTTLVQRVHVPIHINDTVTVARVYKIFPIHNTNLDATVKLDYFELELNGHAESDLGVWRRDSSFWYNPTATVEPNLDRFVIENIDFLSEEWTMAPNAPKIDLRVLLGGPYDNTSGEMMDDLRNANLIPTTEPYADLGYDHPASGGGEQINPAVLAQTGSDAIVDWVFVELRDAADVSTVIAARSALLQKDGDVVDLDGHSTLSFPEITNTETPLISIRHRNHIGIIAASPVDLSNGTVVLDFLANPNLAEGGIAALLDLGDGNYGLISGDFDGDGQVQNTDGNAQTQSLGASGYLPGDSDLNGQVQNTDLQIKLTPNLGRGAQFAY